MMRTLAFSWKCSKRHLSVVSMSTAASQTLQPLVEFDEFVKRVGPTLAPPVANKLIFGDGFLKVMMVGGPNTRRDYHLQTGEEFFWQIKGDLTLDVVVEGRFKTIVVPEGHCFLLPGRVPHSPKRPAKSLGIVIERGHEHAPEEIDRMRWYVEDDEAAGKPAAADELLREVATPSSSSSSSAPLPPPPPQAARVLYEEYFQCTDLGTQLGPVIHRFSAFYEKRGGGGPGDELLLPEPNGESVPQILADPAAPTFGEPFAFGPWIDSCIEKSSSSSAVLSGGSTEEEEEEGGSINGGGGHHVLFQGREKTVSLVVGRSGGGDISPQNSKLGQQQTTQALPFFAPGCQFGGAKAEEEAVATEGLLWQVRGTAKVQTSKREVVLEEGGMLLVDPSEHPAMVVGGSEGGAGDATLVIQNILALRKEADAGTRLSK